MGTNRTAWHVLFFALLSQRAPGQFEVRSEVPLSAEPLRADFLLLLRTPADGRPPETLKKLWARLPRAAIAEFKSVGRPYRGRNLDRLLAYLHIYYADQTELLERRPDLSGVLLVAARTPSLDADVKALGLGWHGLGDGYWELTGGPFAIHVAEIDVVAGAEQDDVLRSFGHAGADTLPARLWMAEQVGTKEIDMDIREMEGYDEVVQSFLKGVPPEQRLAGLAPEQVVLALPDEVLRGLSEAYLASLPEPVRAAVRKRIGRG